MDMTALDRAVEAAGSQLALANTLGIRSPSISGWYDRKKVPVERVLAIESATGVSRYDLRPDVFGMGAEEGSGGGQGAPPASETRTAIAAQVDIRMSKRALRARLGLSSDKQLAKVLQLPVEEIESWEEERALPAVPEVLRLLGLQPEAPTAEHAPEDPDAGRLVSVEVA